MKLVDVNLLLYAVNRDSPKHAAAKAWLEDTLSADERVAIPWIVIVAFIRLATSPRVFERPMAVEDALRVVDSWLDQPQVTTPEAGEEHWRILRGFLANTGGGGNLTTDAHLASLAIEHGAELHSSDSDFARFSGLRWVNPIAG